MTSIYITGLVDPNKRADAIKALVEAGQRLGRTYTIEQARRAIDAAVDSGIRHLLAKVRDPEAAEESLMRAFRALTEGGVLYEWEGNESQIDALEFINNGESEGNIPVTFDEEEDPELPSYQATQVALVLLAITNGNIGTSFNAAMTLAQFLDIEDGFWADEVARVFVDTFNVKVVKRPDE